MSRRPPNAPGLALTALFGLLLLGHALGQEAAVTGVVVGITDGDTCKVLTPGNQLLRVRLSWIDAPESAQAFGQRSKQHLSELVFGRQVELHTHGLDRYGRTLAVIMLDGVDVNLEQVRAGFAWVFEYLSVMLPSAFRQAITPLNWLHSKSAAGFGATRGNRSRPGSGAEPETKTPTNASEITNSFEFALHGYTFMETKESSG
jgi:endonuclease YncB( thermonuclease family)